MITLSDAREYVDYVYFGKYGIHSVYTDPNENICLRVYGKNNAKIESVIQEIAALIKPYKVRAIFGIDDVLV